MEKINMSLPDSQQEIAESDIQCSDNKTDSKTRLNVSKREHFFIICIEA
jgi:hypothetical protein